MKVLLLIAVSVSLALAIPKPAGRAAESCTPDKCKREEGCVCASYKSPLILEDTPQFVTFTFDDSVTNYNYEAYYAPLLKNRRNADNKPISVNFYVPHEYTDYEKVNQLYNLGHEIADFSISKHALVSYWSSASVKVLNEEFGGQRDIISKFANIPKSDIQGVRTPHLQLNGNYSLESYVASGLTYDNSWTTRPDQPLFPYTLDYLSSQQCRIGKCPDNPFKGFWIVPIVNIYGAENRECNVLFSCGKSGTPKEIGDWLVEEFKRTYSKTRVPLSFLVNSAWFGMDENSYEGLKRFLDFLESEPNVYLVSHSEVIRWAKNPKPLKEYQTEEKKRSANCSPVVCPLKFGKDETRYMKSCIPCPGVYPWIGNPTGVVPLPPSPSSFV